MATQLFLLDTASDAHLGCQSLGLGGAGINWMPRALGTARGSGVVASFATPTAAGPTPGQLVAQASAIRSEWISPPVSADVTISGTITANIWAAESSNSANAAINVISSIRVPT